MKLPKTGTTLFKVYELMNLANKEKKQVEIENLRNKFGELVSRSIVSMYVHKLNLEHFEGIKFYTRTIDAKLYIGVTGE